MARIVICGYMIRYPYAGNMLAYFQYVLGLHRLGHEVAYIEESGWPYSCYDPVTRDWYDHPHTGLHIVRQLVHTYNLDIPIYYVNRDTDTVDGGDRGDIEQMLERADLLLNIGGVCWLPEFLLCHRRALIDMDPLFSQVGLFGFERLDDHHIHFSYGPNIGRPGCTIPTAGVEWYPIVPPVIPELWENSVAPGLTAPFTTIGNWSAYGAIVYQGERYGQKDEEFMRLIDLPRYTSQKLELALAVGHEIREQLGEAGWLVRDAQEISSHLDTYQSYIIRSRGEFSVAKNAYVKTHSGAFSDRSVCYLAAGRPVIVQETGFSDWLPTGLGILPFSTMEEAAAAIESANCNYAVHRLAARQIAEEVFSYRVVLPRLLDTALGMGVISSKT